MVISLPLASVLATALYLRAAVADVQFARLEASGVKPTVALQNKVRWTHQHRGLSAGAPNNNEALAAKQLTIKAEAETATTELDSAWAASGTSPALLASWGKK